MSKPTRIWAIADLHLSFGVANKSMDVFGPAWESHAQKIAENWKAVIQPSDLVLVAGDLSWALKLQDAVPDLQWVHELPGTKVMIKGNHDFWWDSLKKISTVLPPSIHLIQNNAFHWKDVAVGGARLWDTPEYSFGQYIQFRENPRANPPPSKDLEEATQEELSQKLFNRELDRLKLSLEALDPQAPIRIAMTHYPPISADLKPSRAAQILEQHQIQICVFGHLHNIKPGYSLFGTHNNIRYHLTSCDYLRFQPLPIL
jgi:predicted phosphohydrolase